jgi:hypothetical protein
VLSFWTITPRFLAIAFESLLLEMAPTGTTDRVKEHLENLRSLSGSNCAAFDFHKGEE